VKKLFITAALVLSLTTTAHAYQQVRSGSWTTYKRLSDTGVPTCGTYVSGSDRDFYIKYQPIDEGAIHFQMFKSTWRFGEGNEVPLVIGFDKNEMIKATARTYRHNNTSLVEFELSGQLATDFLHEFGEADRMWIRFDAGNEQPWVADMRGSRNAAKMLVGCIAELPKATQPFGATPSQPVDKPVKTEPVKKDNGSI
jgi:hypothetical protein